jgi:UDP-glucuronate decarboxylase
MEKKRMYILVTGGAGFLGTHLVDTLLVKEPTCMIHVVDNLSSSDGTRIKNIVAKAPNQRVVFHKADIADWRCPEDVVFDRIYHAACVASPPLYQADPLGTINTCVTGTLRVCQLAKDHGAHVVLFSTSEVYGSPEVMPQRETYTGNINNTGPRSCYDNGKRMLETIGGEFFRMGVDIRIARIFNTYGPGMAAADGRVVTNFIAAALANKPLQLYGGGKQTRSFCYVADMVQGLRRLMDANIVAEDQTNPPVVNLGNPYTHVSVAGLAEIVRALVPQSRSTVVSATEATDDPHRRQPDIARAKTMLGWEPTISLQDGLARTIADMRMNMNMPHE